MPPDILINDLTVLRSCVIFLPPVYPLQIYYYVIIVVDIKITNIKLEVDKDGQEHLQSGLHWS